MPQADRTEQQELSGSSMSEKATPSDLQQQEQQEQDESKLQLDEPSKVVTIEAEAFPVVTGSIAMDPTPEPASVVMESLPAAAPAVMSKKKAAKDGAKKKKKKPIGPPCVGLYVDALDTKMLWSEAQIIDCKLDEQKIKVHFIGWKARWDIWTDTMSIAGHGTYVPLNKKSLAQPRRWDGKTNLFSETELVLNNTSHAIVPLLKDSPAKAEKPASSRSSDGSGQTHRSPGTLILSGGPSPSTPPKVSPSASARKARPAKIAIEKQQPPVKPVIKKSEANGTSNKKSTSDQASESSAGGTAVAKASPISTRTAKVSASSKEAVALPSATSPTVSGKKRSKSSASGSSAKAFSASVSSRERAPKRLKETAELLPANGTAPVDFAATRKQNVAEDEQTASFLQKCALVWKRQLSVLSTRQSC